MQIERCNDSYETDWVSPEWVTQLIVHNVAVVSPGVSTDGELH